ncbi:hypothetical protein ACIQLJ_09895 [Microbacterium sp. NPDC091313]
MTGPAPVPVGGGWDAEGFERAFPSSRADGLRPRPGAAAPLALLGPVGRAWDAGVAVTAELPHGAALGALAAAAEALHGVADAVVLREPAAASPGAPAVAHAAAVLRAILPVLVVLSPRERNRVALEGEVAALADAGAGIVVTGAAVPGGVHDIGEAELTALARRSGAPVAVVAQPAHDREPRRVRQLGRAGAHVCVIAPAGAAERAVFARGLAEERGPRVVFGLAPGSDAAGLITLDTAALPGFAGVHVWAEGAGARDVVDAAVRVREVVS